MKASTILATAATLVDGDRAKTHGDARQSFARAAQLVSAYLGCTVTARDIPMILMLLKVTRTMYGEHNDDDYIDAAGYIALASEVSDG